MNSIKFNQNTAKSKDIDRGGGDNWISNGGITGDTIISLADSRNISLFQLLEECNAGIENFCYSLDNCSNIVIAKIENVIYLHHTKNLLVITLDNDETVYCDLNCIFINREFEKIDACNLEISQSLMPLYITYAKNVPRGRENYKRHENLNDYIVVYNPATGLYDFVHSLADDYNLRNNVYDKNKGSIRHHKNFNKYDNNPTNIDRLTHSEHFGLHSEVASENMKKLHQDPEFQKRHSERASENIKKYLKSEKFYEDTRDAGQRGKESLIKYNKSDKGRAKSSEIGREGKQQCQECGQEVRGRAKMSEHYKTTHPKKWAEGQSALQEGGLEYVRSEAGRKALSERSKSGEFKCHKCGEIVIGASGIRKHYAEKHNELIECHFCGRSFKGKGGLSTHIRFCEENPDHEIREVGHYPCPLCERVFGSQRGLTLHSHKCPNKPKNHKIIKIEIMDCVAVPTFNLQIKNFTNFGLSAGIFIKSY